MTERRWQVTKAGDSMSWITRTRTKMGTWWIPEQKDQRNWPTWKAAMEHANLMAWVDRGQPEKTNK